MAPLVSSISPIASNARVCKEKFEQLSALFEIQDTQTRFDISFDNVAEAHGQLKIWAGNIGAFQSIQSTSSLDFRVREVPKIGKQIIVLLDDLSEALDDVYAIASGERPNRVPSPIGFEGEGQVLQAQPDLNTETSVSTTEIQEVFFSIMETITSLFKISMILRDSASRDRYAKALAKVNKDSAFNSQYDIDHVRNKFPRLDKESLEWLKIRLGKTITNRRQYLRYCRDHHEKLKRVQMNEIRTEAETLEETPSRSGFLDAYTATIRDKETMTAVSRMTGTLASTTATTVIPANMNDMANAEDSPLDDSRSQTSYATSVAEQDEGPSRLFIVRLEEVRRSAGPFECPYCWTIQTVDSQHTWRKHVFQDLKPYICTYEECDMKLFPDRNTWFTHELQNHRVEWQCCFCSHTPHQSRDVFEKHLSSYHSEKFLSAHLSGLVVVCQQPLDRIPAMACPFCEEWEVRLREANSHLQDDETLVVTPQQFRHHVADHMEQLALFAITKVHGEDDEADSSKAVMGHGTDDSKVGHPENVEIETTDNEDTQLDIAAFLGLEDEVRDSIASTPKVRTYSGTWGSPLSAAAAGGRDNILRLFKYIYASPGPMPELLVNTSSSLGAEGWTALHWAASNGHMSTCMLLIEYGAFLCAKSLYGYTVWDLARYHGHSEVATFLESFLSPRIRDNYESKTSDTSFDKEIMIYITPAQKLQDGSFYDFKNNIPRVYSSRYEFPQQFRFPKSPDQTWESRCNNKVNNGTLIEIMTAKREEFLPSKTWSEQWSEEWYKPRAESFMPGIVLFRVGEVVDMRTDELDTTIICDLKSTNKLPVNGAVKIRLVEYEKSLAEERRLSIQTVNPSPNNIETVTVAPVASGEQSLLSHTAVSEVDSRTGTAARTSTIRIGRVPSEELLVKQIYQCTEAIDLHGLLNPRIYSPFLKHNPNALLTELKKEYEDDSTGSITAYRHPIVTDILSVGSVLIRLLAELPEPLLTYSLYIDFIDSSEISNPVENRNTLAALVRRLPEPNYSILNILMLHLKRIEKQSSVNGMTAISIAQIFGPLLLRPRIKRTDGNSSFQMIIMENLLLHAYDIFEEMTVDLSSLRPLQISS